jgi:hypothetical protein
MKLPIGNQVLLLDNSMFDNGGVECKNFTVCTANDYANYEWHTIRAMFPQDMILQAIGKGERHLNVKHLGITVECELVLELQWD